MSLPHQKFREIVFLTLYSYDLGQSNNEDIVPLLMKELSVTRKATIKAQAKARTVLDHLAELDELLAKTSSSYSFSRIQSVERNALRLGLFELLYDPAVPPKVAIAEAMRITRKFATPSAAQFVNAVLDQLYRLSQGEKIDEKVITQTVKELHQLEDIAREASLDPLFKPGKHEHNESDSEE